MHRDIRIEQKIWHSHVPERHIVSQKVTPSLTLSGKTINNNTKNIFVTTNSA